MIEADGELIIIKQALMKAHSFLFQWESLNMTSGTSDGVLNAVTDGG